MHYKKRIIYLNDEGRFGHQLSQFLTIWMHCLENNYAFNYPDFEKKYLKYFENHIDSYLFPTDKSNLFTLEKSILFFIKTFKIEKFKLGRKIDFRLSHSTPKKLIFDEELSTITNLDSPRIGFNHLLNDTPSIVKHKDAILKLFNIKRDFEDLIHKEIVQTTADSKIKVGVHIRRTDFKDFAKGKFYFEDSVYLTAMQRFLKVFSLNKEEVTFFICSDEHINIENFKNLNMYFRKRELIEDFALLKNMDYIIAPRSIFSTMANFYGQNKIYQIMNKGYHFEQFDFVTSDFLLKVVYDLKNNPDLII